MNGYVFTSGGGRHGMDIYRLAISAQYCVAHNADDTPHHSLAISLSN